MRRGSLIAAAAAMAVFTLGSLAARGQDRSGPAQPPLWLPDAEYLRWPLPPSEQAYAALSGKRIKGYIDEITAISRKRVGSNTVSARRWFVGGSDRLKAIVANSFKTFGIAIYSRPETRPGGELGVVYTDAPSFHIIDHAIYHTDLDTAALVPEPGLEAAVRAFAKIIDEVNTVDIADIRVASTRSVP